MVYKKEKGISQLKENDSFGDIFVVRFKKPVLETRKGTYYFGLKVQDAFGEIMLKYWGKSDRQAVEKVYESIEPDSAVYAEGNVSEYNGNLELSVNDGKLKPLKQGEFDLDGLIRKSDRDTDEMYAELEKLIASVKDSELKKTLDAFFSDAKFVERFKFSPAAMYKHHGWLSGLLEHTLNVVNTCCDVSKHHKLDRDLLIAGAVLHDIGKIEEFETTSLIKVTDKGNLLGHIAIGVQMLSAKLGGLGISDNTKNKLLHIVVSHHGRLEFGSPKLPAFPEALVIAKADEIDAFTSQMVAYKENASTEDNFIYSKDFGANIYLK